MDLNKIKKITFFTLLLLAPWIYVATIRNKLINWEYTLDKRITNVTNEDVNKMKQISKNNENLDKTKIFQK